MQFFELFHLLTRRIGRLSRRKWLILLASGLSIVLAGSLVLHSALLIIHQFTNFFHWLDCLSGKMLARHEICLVFEKNQISGNLCHDWCSDSSTVIQSCPSPKNLHSGKECVFQGTWKGNQIVVKAKKLKASNLMDNDLKLTKEEFVQGLQTIVSSSFEGSTNVDASLLIPWDKDIEEQEKLSSLSEKELQSLWLLSQDNEFLYSQVIGHLEQFNQTKLFPFVYGTCGHFYAVEFIPDYIKLSDVLPNEVGLISFMDNWPRRLNIARMLLEFMLNLESLGFNLLLCDVKYDQFAIQNGTALLIDSDMLYPSDAVRESIHHIDSCIQNTDCDFFDCKGRCKSNNYGDICDIDFDQDSNLKRLCRNILFIESTTSNELSSQISGGLLSYPPSADQSDAYAIRQLCSRWIKENEMISTINKMIDLASAMQSRLQHYKKR